MATKKRITKTKKMWPAMLAIAVIVVVFVLAIVLLQNKTPGEEEMSNTIIIKTNKGIIKAELFTEQAPITSANFIKLTNEKFYDGLGFHRYEPGFVIQGGDPKGDGTGGSKDSISLEIVPELVHDAGVLSMARTNDPNSATSQFYITLAPAHFLDGNYAVFGKVTEGMDVVLALRAGDVMEEVTYNE